MKTFLQMSILVSGLTFLLFSYTNMSFPALDRVKKEAHQEIFIINGQPINSLDMKMAERIQSRTRTQEEIVRQDMLNERKNSPSRGLKALPKIGQKSTTDPKDLKQMMDQVNEAKKLLNKRNKAIDKWLKGEDTRKLEY